MHIQHHLRFGTILQLTEKHCHDCMTMLQCYYKKVVNLSSRGYYAIIATHKVIMDTE
jgi:hypothetical protein